MSQVIKIKVICVGCGSQAILWVNKRSEVRDMECFTCRGKFKELQQ